MNTDVNKTKVIFTIISIFLIAFTINLYMSYENKKSDIYYIQKNIEENIKNVYDEVSSSMLQKQLQMRSEFMLEKYNKKEKLQAFKDRDKEKLKELFSVHFEALKDQIKGFEIMQFIDRDGNSILRMHNLGKDGDDLKKIRACIVSVVENPRTCSFFEVGLQGLAYRHITPVYLKNELVGFFEVGVKPTLLIKKIEKIFGLNGYFFIKNQYIPSNMNRNIHTIKTDDYTLCQFCSQKDDFISSISSKLNFEKRTGTIIKHGNQTYTTIDKKIYDALGNHIGELIIFQDITLFENQLNKLLMKFFIVMILAAIIIYIILNKYITSIFSKLNRARYLLDNTNDAVYVVRLNDALIVDVNERASLMLGFEKKELLKKTVFDIREPLPGTPALDWKEHVRDLKLKHFLTSRGMHIKKDGERFPVEANLSYIHDGQEYMIAVVRDITKQLEMEEKIKHKANELERLHKVISKAVLYTTSDLDGKITSVSRAFEELSGYKEAELIGKNHSLFRNPNTPKDFYKNMWETLGSDEQFIGEIKNYDKDRSEYWIKLTIDPLFDENGIKIGYSSYRENITDKKELEYISAHDTLTGVYNRKYFQDELSKKINGARRYNQEFGFVMLDIDHFKSVNDIYGHQVGDEVLKTIAECIQTHIREDDIFARWGGEEFVIIANGADIEHLKLLIRKLQKEIKKASFSPVPDVTSSFGITVYQEGDNSESIQKRADDALYKAKENGRDRFEIN